MFFKKKSFLIVCFLFILFILLQFTYAIDCDKFVEQTIDDDKKVDIYFDSSAANDGDGSQEKPYKHLYSIRIVNNSNIHLADGEYVFNSSYNYSTGNGYAWGHSSSTHTIGNYTYYTSLSNVYNVSFIGQGSDKTIIYGNTSNIWFFDSNLALNNLTFINNNFRINNGTLIADNVVFKDSTAYYRDGFLRGIGGVISTNGNSNIEIYNSKFINTSSQYGGAIYMNTGYLKIVNSIFSNTISTVSGASICCENNVRLNISKSKFVNTSSDMGGVIYINGGNLFIDNSSFINSSSTSSGGALCCENDVGVSILNSDFDNTKSVNSEGGSVYLYYSSLDADNVNFTNCFAGFGGVICTLGSFSNINNSCFKDNIGNYSAGAIYAAFGELNISNSKFINNSLKDASVVIDKSTICLNNNEFISNSTEIIAYFIDLDITSNDGLNSENAREIKELSFNINASDYILFKFNLTEFTGELPSYYSLVDDGYVTSVKDQKNGGNCWSFTAMSVLESCILKLTNITYDLSEQNLKNLMALYSRWGWISLPNDGGKVGMTIGYLSSWSGPILDVTDQYLDNNALSNVFDSIFHIDNVVLIKRNNFTDNDAVKRAVLTYGAVGGDLCYNDAYLNTETNAYFCYDNYATNHAITIVGWNDSYSRYNFKTIPEGDGAWIVKNSWGADWGDNGYFYVSYYDRVVSTGDSSFLYTILLNNTRKYDRNYQYDLGFSSISSYQTNSFSYKNVFTAEDDEYLTAVSTYFFSPVDWVVSIYVNDTFIMNKTGSSPAGYHTIDLGKVIKVNKGDEFSVIFKQNVGDGEYVKLPIMLYKDFANPITFPGVSFVYNEGKWNDLSLTVDPGVLCIKAFTVKSLSASIKLNYTDSNITATIRDSEGNLLKEGKVIFNISDHIESVDIADGVAFLEYDFTHKEYYDVTATLNLTGYESSSVFEMIHTRLDINLTIKNITYNDKIILNITLNHDLALINKVNVKIGDRTYEIVVLNDATVYEVSDLFDAGNYTAELTYLDHFNSINKNVSFKISKASNNINVTVENVTFSQKSVIIVKADVDGVYQVKINDTMVNVGVSNGEGSSEVQLNAGEYSAGIDWADDNYNVDIQNTTFKVSKQDISMSLEADVLFNDVDIGITLSRPVNVSVVLNISGDIKSLDMVEGKGVLKLIDLAQGNYEVYAVFNNTNYEIADNSTAFTINSYLPDMLINVKNITVGEVLVITVTLSSDYSITPTGNVTFFIGNSDATQNLTSGSAKIYVHDLTYGEYLLKVNYSGDDLFSPLNSDTTFSVLRIRPNITISNSISYGENINMKLSNDMKGNLTMSINGKVYNINYGRYDFNIDIPDLEIGSYDVNVSFAGDNKYLPLNISTNLAVNKVNSVISANSISANVIGIAKGLSYSVTLKDANGNALNNKNLNIVFDGKTYRASTGSAGVANFKLYSSSSGSKSIVIRFNGDSYCNAVSATKQVKIAKVKTSLKVPSKTYKKSSKSKKLQATLKDAYGKVIKNAKITFKIKSKKYTAKTNAKGVATVKVKLTKKGSYNVKVSFSANNMYLSCSKSAKLKIK